MVMLAHVKRRRIITSATHTLHTHILHNDWKRKRWLGGRSSKCGGCSRGRGQNYTGARMVAKSGLCAALGINVFDDGHRAAADQMRTSWEKLVQFVGTNYGQDISNELQNKIPMILSEPVYTLEVLARHAI
jgi:uncharacterized protein CbrC (UPF0167 family)